MARINLYEALGDDAKGVARLGSELGLGLRFYDETDEDLINSGEEDILGAAQGGYSPLMRSLMASDSRSDEDNRMCVF